MKKTESVLYSNTDWANGVESPQRSFNGVRYLCLSPPSKFHQNVVCPFFYSHDFRDSVSDFDDFRHGGPILYSEHDVNFSVLEDS